MPQSAQWFMKPDYRRVSPTGLFRQHLLLACSTPPDMSYGECEEGTSEWKQAGIYSLETVGGCITSAPISGVVLLSIFLATINNRPPIPSDFVNAGAFYVPANTLLTGTATWLVGKLLRQKVSWWKAVAGPPLVLCWELRWTTPHSAAIPSCWASRQP